MEKCFITVFNLPLVQYNYVKKSSWNLTVLLFVLDGRLSADSQLRPVRVYLPVYVGGAGSPGRVGRATHEHQTTTESRHLSSTQNEKTRQEKTTTTQEEEMRKGTAKRKLNEV